MIGELVKAIQSGDVLQVALLLRDDGVKSKLNDKNEVGNLVGMFTSGGMYPIQYATGNLTMLQTLIEAGANPNIMSNLSPLTLACMNDHLDCIEYLLSAGADMNANLGLASTPIGYACEYMSLSTLKFMVERGADLTLYFGNDIGASSLYRAYSSDNYDVFNYIIENHIDKVKHICKYIFKDACFHKGQGVILETLLQKTDVDPNMLVNDMPLLHRVIQSNDFDTLDIVEILLRYGADVDTKDNSGKTALDWAIDLVEHKIAELLRSHMGRST